VKALVISLLALSSFASAQGIIFCKEDITFRLTSKYFLVDGTYWFSNPSGHETESLIYYPFSIAAGTDSVDSVDIVDLSKGFQPRISNRTDAGFSFVLTMAGHDTALYHIAYRQRVSGDSAAYILRSAQAWNRPLEYAEYKLMAENSISVTEFSYKPDKIYDFEGKKIYLWRRSSFMPDRDFVIHFKPK